MSRGVLVLAPGLGLDLDGARFTVEELQPHLGRVVLADVEGERSHRSLRRLANHPDIRLLPAAGDTWAAQPPPGPARGPAAATTPSNGSPSKSSPGSAKPRTARTC